MKTILVRALQWLGVLIILALFFWFVFGAGVPVTKDLLGIGRTYDRVIGVMTPEENAELMKRTSTPDEGAVNMD